ncbi:MAG: RNA 2',3'-cyclic phosphodiesterase, partial [Solirubrobacteraceae bacterium]
IGVDGRRGVRRRAGKVRLLEPETLHLTLCFLGSRPVQELAPIAAAVQGMSAFELQLSLGAPLWLPPRRPRTLALAVHDHEGELARLHGSVVEALAQAIDWRPERRRFRAHITVARLGREHSRERRSESEEEPSLTATPQLSFTAHQVVLYRSWLAPAGANYELLGASAIEESSEPSSDDWP